MRFKAKTLWALGASLVVSGSNGVLAQEDPLNIVAAAVRATGHACDDPKSAVPDPQATSPDEKAWIIDCGNATYRVKFAGDAAVDVSPVDG